MIGFVKGVVGELREHWAGFDRVDKLYFGFMAWLFAVMAGFFVSMAVWAFVEMTVA